MKPRPGDRQLGDGELAQWRDRGWLVLPGAVAFDLAERLRTWVEQVAAWADCGGPGLHHFEQTDRGPAIARSEYFADDHDDLGRFIRQGVVVETVTRLLAEPAVLFKEKINYKHPGGGGFAPHQDAGAYRFGDHHISVMVPVDPATEAAGCLWFAPGYETGPLETDGRGRIAEAVVDRLEWLPVEVDPGDLVFFDSYTPHRSGTNNSDRPRRALYLTYNARSNGDHRERYYADKLAEFARLGGTFSDERVRISISDDFLGRPVAGRPGRRVR